MAHVLGDYGTDPSGEMQVAAFSAGFRKEQTASILLFVLCQFDLGVRMTPVAKAEVGNLDPDLFLAALVRGSRMNVDLLSDGWSYWPVIAEPVEALRERYGIPAEGLSRAVQPTIRTPRLVLRPLSDDDLEPFALMNADPRVMRYFPAPMTRAQSEAQLARLAPHVAEHGFGMWAVELPGEARFIGIAGLNRASFEAPFTPCVEVGWRLAAEHWGRGYATEAGRASLRYGFQALGLDEILAWTAVINAPSRRVMEKLGMERDSAGDFEHPRVPAGHFVRPHVLYRVGRARFDAAPAG